MVIIDCLFNITALLCITIGLMLLLNGIVNNGDIIMEFFWVFVVAGILTAALAITRATPMYKVSKYENILAARTALEEKCQHEEFSPTCAYEWAEYRKDSTNIAKEYFELLKE